MVYSVKGKLKFYSMFLKAIRNVLEGENLWYFYLVSVFEFSKTVGITG